MAQKISTLRMIIETLMSGDPLRSREIAEIILERFGREVKIQDVASMLSRISNPVRCDLGYFIDKTPAGNGFSYCIVEEFLMLPVEKAYRMTLKGKNFFSPEDAVAEKPELKKYLERERTIPSRRKSKVVVPAEKAVAKEEAAPAETTIVTDQDCSAEGISVNLSSLQAIVNQLKNINLNITVSVKLDN